MRAANAALLRNLRALWARPPFFLPGSTGGTKANPVTSLPTPERGGWRAQRAGRGQPPSGLYNSLPGRAIHNPQRPKDAVKPKNLRPQSGRQTLELFPQPFSTTLLHNPPPTGGHNPRGEAPSTLPSEPSEPFEPSEPSRRRRVHGVSKRSAPPWYNKEKTEGAYL